MGGFHLRNRKTVFGVQTCIHDARLRVRSQTDYGLKARIHVTHSQRSIPDPFPHRTRLSATPSHLDSHSRSDKLSPRTVHPTAAPLSSVLIMTDKRIGKSQLKAPEQPNINLMNDVIMEDKRDSYVEGLATITDIQTGSDENVSLAQKVFSLDKLTGKSTTDNRICKSQLKAPKQPNINLMNDVIMEDKRDWYEEGLASITDIQNGSDDHVSVAQKNYGHEGQQPKPGDNDVQLFLSAHNSTENSKINEKETSALLVFCQSLTSLTKLVKKKEKCGANEVGARKRE